MNRNLIIVGFGMSAGGIDPLIQFVEQLPDRPGAAFVVLQHISPDYTSSLDEILSKHTTLPVQKVETSQYAEKNKLYYPAPRFNLIFEEGILRPVPKKSRTVPHAIDEFFDSLGKSSGTKVIGIIFSGNGSDGSKGIKQIATGSGIVLAQDPSSAAYPSMPRTAIASGHVDFVLDPQALAIKTVELIDQMRKFPLLKNWKDPESQKKLQHILDMLETSFGVDFNKYTLDALRRRLGKRMAITGNSSLTEYQEFLLGNKEEEEYLVRELLTGITWFFRNPEAFELLRTKIIPALFAQKGKGDPVRVWVPGCATGEEAYSLAILMEEYVRHQAPSHSFLIYASDLNEKALDFARRGIYSPGVAQEVEIDYLSTYFVKTEDGQQVRPDLKNNVIFTRHDALNDPPFINIDLITCRNLLINFRLEAQKSFIANFRVALNRDGYLMLGPGEAIGEVHRVFKNVDKQWNVFHNAWEEGKSSKTFVQPYFQPGWKRREGTPNLNISKEQERQIYREEKEGEEFEEWLMERFVPISLILNEELEVKFIFGEAEKLIRFPRRPGRFHIQDLVGEQEWEVFLTGVRRTEENQEQNWYRNISFFKGEKELVVDICFEPVSIPRHEKPMVLVTFHIKQEQTSRPQAEKEPDLEEERRRALRIELKKVQEEKQVLIDRLERMNQDLQTSNEELLTANEELKSSNEELQSVNEELYIVNSELQKKVEELTIVNSDVDHLFASIDIGTVYLDKNLKIRKFTPAISHQFDLEEQDVGRPITSFEGTFKNDDFQTAVAWVVQNGKRLEKQVSGRNGKIFLMRILPYKKFDSTFEGVVITFVDISEIEKANEEIQSLASKFRALYSNVQNQILEVDPNLLVQQANFAFGTFTPEEMKGRDFTEFLVPEDQEKLLKASKEVRKTSRKASFDARLLLQDREDNSYHCLLIPVNSGDSIESFLIILQDITRQKMIEKEVRKKAAIFTNIFRYGQEHITLTDAEGKITDVNFTASGLDKEKLLGQPIFDLQKEGSENQKKIKAAIEKIKNGAKYSRYQSSFESLGGKTNYYDNLVFPILENGEIESFVILTRPREFTPEE